MITPVPRFAFFGSSRMSVVVLDELARIGLRPVFIVTTPDQPEGRHLTITPNVVRVWARGHDIPDFAPARLDASFADTLAAAVRDSTCDVFVVASYGRIIPRSVIDLPRRKTLNIHPSLLPIYRGPSPLQAAMLDDRKETGVTIMRIDEQVDHGPIIAQEQVFVKPDWPIYEDFEEMMARSGARLLARVMPDWIDGTLSEREQDHSYATHTRKIAKSDGLIDIVDGDPRANFCKIQAYHAWPVAYFLAKRRGGGGSGGGSGGMGGAPVRVKVTAATYLDGELIIERVIPEGRSEMSYKDFLTGYTL